MMSRSSSNAGVATHDPSAPHGVWTKPTSESEEGWTYLYRVVDKRGLTVDLLLSEHRDIAAAKRFFIRAIERHGAPDRITLDGYPPHARLWLSSRGVECCALRPRSGRVNI